MNIPIATATAPLDALNLFPQIEGSDYQTLCAQGQAPSFLASAPFKAWIDPDAPTAPATPGPDPKTGIWYKDAFNVEYGVWQVAMGPTPPYPINSNYVRVLMTRQEAANYNCPDPSSQAFNTVQQSAAVIRAVPQRPLDPAESFVPGPIPFGAPVVQNNTIVAAQQQAAQTAQQAIQAARAAGQFTQTDADRLQWLCANAGMPGVQKPTS